MRIDNIEFGEDLDTILSELKNQLTLNDIDMLGTIRPTGYDNIMVSCPYHKEGKERRPSAGIKRIDGVFHCFACGETHSLPEVISYCFGRYDNGAFGWNWLIKNFLTIEVEERKDVHFDFSRGDSSSVGRHSKKDDTGAVRYVSEEELDQYRYYHPYWAERGITDESIIELFDLGYDREAKSITFPVRDIKGNCLFVARRSVRTKFFNYPTGVEKPLYGLYELQYKRLRSGRYAEDVIVCESMIDCVLLWQAGFYAVALNGLGNNLQFKQLEELPCRHLMLATDNDEAGDKARDRIRRFVKGKIFSEIIFPEGIKDIGECTRLQQENINLWEEYI